MKTTVSLLAAALLGALVITGLIRANTPSNSWRLAFAHDKGGVAVEGSKQALIDAILAGKPVRVYWAGRTVQHVVDAGFLTVLGGEVFAQMRPIMGQKPMTDPAVTIELRENTWQTVLATNGERALRWFVQH